MNANNETRCADCGEIKPLFLSPPSVGPVDEKPTCKACFNSAWEHGAAWTDYWADMSEAEKITIGVPSEFDAYENDITPEWKIKSAMLAKWDREMVPATLAHVFASRLGARLTEKERAEVLVRNARETHPSICASGDFCDSNMAMAEAFRAIYGREPDTSSDPDIAVWNAAWHKAKRAGFWWVA